MSTVRKMTPTETGLNVQTDRALKPVVHGLEEFFDNFFGNFPGRRAGSFADPFRTSMPFWQEFASPTEADIPRIEMIEREKELFVRAEMPGVSKDDLEITILGDRLTLQGKREYKDVENNETFYRSEMGYGTLSRTVVLPCEVDEKHVKAQLKDGILELSLPKIEIRKRHTVKVTG